MKSDSSHNFKKTFDTLKDYRKQNKYLIYSWKIIEIDNSADLQRITS